jgi:hypothetical protein
VSETISLLASTQATCLICNPPPQVSEQGLQSLVDHEYPAAGVQLKEPTALVQVARPQPPLFTRHSLMSLHIRPLPEYPDGHGPHVCVLGSSVVGARLVHVAKQPPLLIAHSLTSVQVSPLPL